MTDPKKPRGFQTLSPERRREIASSGGKTAHREGRAHKFSSEEAREAGRKGGLTRARRAADEANRTPGVNVGQGGNDGAA